MHRIAADVAFSDEGKAGAKKAAMHEEEKPTSVALSNSSKETHVLVVSPGSETVSLEGCEKGPCVNVCDGCGGHGGRGYGMNDEM